jgi:hypothetical protein
VLPANIKAMSALLDFVAKWPAASLSHSWLSEGTRADMRLITRLITRENQQPP